MGLVDLPLGRLRRGPGSALLVRWTVVCGNGGVSDVCLELLELGGDLNELFVLPFDTFQKSVYPLHAEIVIFHASARWESNNDTMRAVSDRFLGQSDVR